MKLETLTQEQVLLVAKWRNNEMEVCRTPFMLTEEIQEDFYKDIVSNRESNHRYWAVVRTIEDEIKGIVPESGFIGMGGITYIQWENRIGEITLIIDPKGRGSGEGEKAVDLLLDQAFNYLNLQTVFGEVYYCNETGYNFWWKIADKYKSPCADLYHRKYWKGQYYNSMYFSIDKDDFNNRNQSGQ